MYVEGKFREYLDDFAGSKPAPGGGSAAAAAGALGLAALSMVGSFTVGKEKYAEVEDEMRAILENTERLRTRLQELVDADVEGYSAVSNAYGMPGETDEQKAARSAAIQDALVTAMYAPLETCRALGETVELARPLLERGNRNLVSDVAVGAELITGAFESALFNVNINLSGIKNEELVRQTRSELENLRSRIHEMRNSVVEKAREMIG